MKSCRKHHLAVTSGNNRILISESGRNHQVPMGLSRRCWRAIFKHIRCFLLSDGFSPSCRLGSGFQSHLEWLTTLFLLNTNQDLSSRVKTQCLHRTNPQTACIWGELPKQKCDKLKAWTLSTDTPFLSAGPALPPFTATARESMWQSSQKKQAPSLQTQG